MHRDLKEEFQNLRHAHCGAGGLVTVLEGHLESACSVLEAFQERLLEHAASASGDGYPAGGHNMTLREEVLDKWVRDITNIVA